MQLSKYRVIFVIFLAAEWFPKHISELDNCNHLLMKFDPDLDHQHPVPSTIIIVIPWCFRGFVLIIELAII